MSKAISEKEDRGPGRHWEPTVETAPSVMREDEPTFARSIGLAGASFVIFGGLALLLNIVGRTERVGIGMASSILALGVIGLLSHAAYDRDLQIRRLYWGGGIALFCAGILLCLIPVDGVGGLFGVGYPCISLAMLFLLATLHHERDPFIRQVTSLLFLGAGVAGTFCWLVLGSFLRDPLFLVPYGTMLGVLAIAYLAAYVSHVGIASERGYQVALGMTGVGMIAILLGVVRSLFLDGYLVPEGLLLITLGLLYLGISFGLCSDNRIVVLTRRELSSFFFSPLIYLVLAGFTFVAWWSYKSLGNLVIEFIVPEPIIKGYLWGLWPVLTVSFLVPVLTMRLLSEEKRSGSLELLLTAPVNESTVVVSKFLSAFLLYLLMWAPWWLFLIALRVGGRTEFEYRSLFSFLVALSFTGAGFVAMGLFFSSLTRNQVASAVLTFAGMMAFLGLYLVRNQLLRGSPWAPVLMHADYIELWLKATDGILSLKYLLFHASSAVIWLFLTVKVLEARRWA